MAVDEYMVNEDQQCGKAKGKRQSIAWARECRIAHGWRGKPGQFVSRKSRE